MASTTITIFGTKWCGDCRRAVRLFDDHEVTYTYIDIEHDDQARAYVEHLNNGYRSVPTIVFPDGSVMVEPSAAALSQKLATLAGVTS